MEYKARELFQNEASAACWTNLADSEVSGAGDYDGQLRMRAQFPTTTPQAELVINNRDRCPELNDTGRHAQGMAVPLKKHNLK